MRNSRQLILFQGALGGLICGLCLSGRFSLLMPISIALLWSSSKDIVAGALWGLIAVLVSHRWILSLHPLTWIGIPSAFSLPIAISIWLLCGSFGSFLVAIWSFLRTKVLPENLIILVNNSNKYYSLIFLSGLWGLSEVLLAKSPFFWIGVGTSFLPGDRFIAGLAKWIGSGGLATCQLLIGFWLWELILIIKRKDNWKYLFAIGSSLIIFMHILGGYLLRDTYQGDSFQVALFQPNLPIRERYLEQKNLLLAKNLEESLLKAQRLSASWLVAPEGTISSYGGSLPRLPIPMLSGGFRRVEGEQRNSILVYEKGTFEPSVTLDKHRLVPLGEWTPKFFGFPSYGLSSVGNLHPGQPSRYLDWSGPPLAGIICYEISDGNAVANSVAEGAQWLLAIANLDPYPILIQKQFLMLSQLRSIETARDLISVANTGPSGLISKSGKVKNLVPPFVKELQIVNLNLNNNITFYTRFKELPLLLFFLYGLFGLIIFRLKFRT